MNSTLLLQGLECPIRIELGVSYSKSSVTSESVWRASSRNSRLDVNPAAHAGRSSRPPGSRRSSSRWDFRQGLLHREHPPREHPPRDRRPREHPPLDRPPRDRRPQEDPVRHRGCRFFLSSTPTASRSDPFGDGGSTRLGSLSDGSRARTIFLSGPERAPATALDHSTRQSSQWRSGSTRGAGKMPAGGGQQELAKGFLRWTDLGDTVLARSLDVSVARSTEA